MHDDKTRVDAVTLWLYACCGMIFTMALIGAITRLTESGLSITEWNPVTGVLPPMGDAAWQKVFAQYQAIPQYQILNRGMTLEEFKGIFFWEWVHRLWGRMIGAVFFLPLIWFAVRRKIDKPLLVRLLAIFALGGLQGFIGWFMVQSGLETRTSVSPYRLAIHLCFALLLYTLILWTALRRGRIAVSAPSGKFRTHGYAALGLLCVTIFWGALVAGLHAGEAYNTWPLMDGAVLPAAAWSIQPVWHNAFENLALVQFIHRWLGPATILTIIAWALRQWNAANTEQRKWLGALNAMAVLQACLGLTTLLTHVEIVVAVTHQAGAITLLTLLLVNLHAFYSRTESK